jgi:glucan 1,3-beta-glucosidase
VAIELVNEAFVTIPIEVVKDFYLQGYSRVKKYGDLAVVIGDSFRFGSWNDFMFPPHYRHVWIDTHIYQVFDMYRLSFTWDQHLDQTCKQNKPEVAVAPLSTMVGEFSLAITDCAKWLNGYGIGARYDGTYWQTFPQGRAPPLGSCVGHDDVHNTTIYTSEFKEFLKKFAEMQMDAYESGSSAGWFFWNFKTESSPQWDYIMGLKHGWMPSDHSKRQYKCD